jgi:hypothetical protein
LKDKIEKKNSIIQKDSKQKKIAIKRMVIKIKIQNKYFILLKDPKNQKNKDQN